MFYSLTLRSRAGQFPSSNSVYSFRILSILLTDNGLIDDRVACIAKPVLMSLKHPPCKLTSTL